MDTQKIYHEMGISSAVLAFCCSAEEELKPRFAAIDAIAEYNQAKVVAAMQKNRVSAECFAASTGYGYNDIGREALEKSMPIPSTPKPPWSVRRSPAAPMRWRWRWPPISAPAMSFTLRSAVPTILSRKSSASAPARAHWPSSASPTGRPNCCRMAPSIMKISVNQSTKNQAGHHPALQGLCHPPHLLGPADRRADPLCQGTQARRYLHGG